MGNCIGGTFTPPYSPEDVQTWPQGMQAMEIINQVCAVARFIVNSKLTGAAEEVAVIRQQIGTMQALAGRWKAEWAPCGVAAVKQPQQLPIVTSMVGLVDQLSRIKVRLERLAVKPVPVLGGQQRTASKAVKLLQAALDAHDTFKSTFLAAVGSGAHVQASYGTQTSRNSRERASTMRTHPNQQPGTAASYMHQMYWSDGEGSPARSLHPDMGTLQLGSVTAAPGVLVPHPAQQYMLVLTPSDHQMHGKHAAQGSTASAGAVAAEHAAALSEPIKGVLLPVSAFSRPGSSCTHSPHAGSPHASPQANTQGQEEDEFLHVPDSPHEQSQAGLPARFVNHFHAPVGLSQISSLQDDRKIAQGGPYNSHQHRAASASPFLVKQASGQQQQDRNEAAGRLDAAMEQLGTMLRVRAAEQSGDTAALVATLTAAADSGDAAACLRLAQLYQSGKALVYLPSSSAPAAAITSGSSSSTSTQTQHAMQHAAAAYWYHHGLQYGDVDCAAGLGYLLEFGLGVAADLQAAVQVYSWAALRGSAAATNNLARLLAEGRGVTQDLGTAQQLFERAARAGSADAAYNLATSLTLNHGPRWSQSGTAAATDADKQQQQAAMFWLTQASRAGHTEAALQLLNVLWRSGQHAAALTEVMDASAAGSAGAAVHTAQLLEQIATWIAEADPVHHSSLPADLDPKLLGMLSDVPALLPPVGLQLRSSRAHTLAHSMESEAAKADPAGSGAPASRYSSTVAADGAVRVDVRGVSETDDQVANRKLVEAALQAGLTPAEQLHAAAKRWYLQAAQAGEPAAQLWVGHAYLGEGRTTAAMAMWRRAMRAGNAAAALMCGHVEEDEGCMLLANGAHMDQIRHHLHEALSYYKRAQELGLADGEDHVQRAELLLDELDMDHPHDLASRAHSVNSGYGLHGVAASGFPPQQAYVSAVDNTWLTQQLSTSMRMGSVRSVAPGHGSSSLRRSVDGLRYARRTYIPRAQSLQAGPAAYQQPNYLDYISRAHSLGPGIPAALAAQGSYGVSSQHSSPPRTSVPSRLGRLQHAQSAGPKSTPYMERAPHWKSPGRHSSNTGPGSMQQVPYTEHASTRHPHLSQPANASVRPKTSHSLSALQRSVSESLPGIASSSQGVSAAAFMAAAYKRAAGSSRPWSKHV